MIFVDTGAWVTQFSKRDQYHAAGARIFEQLRRDRALLSTTTPVVYETITFLTREVGVTTAIKAGRQITGWQGLRIFRPDLSDETAALFLMEKFSDQPIGFVDCLSFALMRRERITTAFTFDRHFQKAGFSVLTTNE